MTQVSQSRVLKYWKLSAGLATAWYVCVELLSAMRWLNTTTLSIAAALAVLVIFYNAYADFKSWLKADYPLLSHAGKWIRIWAGLLFTLLFFLCLWVPPGTWDSMTYHMPRIEHWLQNGSEAHYPTHILRQLYSAPLAEYMLMGMRSLTGSDYLYALLQFGAYLGCGCCMYALIRKHTPASQELSTWMCLLALCLPAAVLESTSTFNDLVLAYWLLGSWIMLEDYLMHPTAKQAFWIAIGLALAWLTKAVAVFGLIALAIYALLRLIQSRHIFESPKPQALLMHTAFMALVLVGLAMPLGLKHYQAWGQWQGPPAAERTMYTNTQLSLEYTASNMARNLATQSLIPDWTLANDKLIKGPVLALHEALGWLPDDPATTWPGASFVQARGWFDEGTPSNYTHTFIFLLILALSIYHFKKIKPYGLLLSVPAIAFVLFCLYLKWQPYHGRLLIFIYWLSLPYWAAVLHNVPRMAVLMLVWLTLLTTTSNVLYKSRKHYLPLDSGILSRNREARQYDYQPQAAEAWKLVLQGIEGYKIKQVGLVLNPDTWEYPLWAMQRNKGMELTIHHVNVLNESSAIPQQFVPECIVSAAPIALESITYARKKYCLIQSKGGLHLYLPSK